MEMKLKKKYVTRGGNVSGKLKINLDPLTNHTHPFQIEIEGSHHKVMADGKIIEGMICTYDLVSRYKELKSWADQD